MANHRKKNKLAKKHHIGSTSDAAIVLRPPSPPLIVIPELNVTDHTHRKNHKGRVIVMIWGRRSTTCYEEEFCPECPIDRVKEALLDFCKADTGYFSRANWLTLRGQSAGTLHKTFSPHSAYQMIDFMKLIKTRDYHGGKITLKIVRRGQVRLSYT